MVKSRCMGASWLIVVLFLHRWMFFDALAFGVVSREEKLVDGRPKSLFAKIQFVLNRLPTFMVPQYDHFHLQFVNHTTGSSIEGSTTTGNVFRGDRYTAVMIDEYAAFDPQDSEKAWAASNSATNCRILNSTPQGQTGAFYRAAHDASVKRLDLWWHQHPEYSAGIRKVPGVPGFTSPWYEKECRRLGTVGAIAQELNLDFLGSGRPFFDEPVLREHEEKYCVPPISFKKWTVERGAARDPIEVSLDLWIYEPGVDSFIVGSDISQGAGSTPSTLSIWSKLTREKVGELATPFLEPQLFAWVAVQVCEWFNKAFLIFEKNGPGDPFGKRVIALGYRNVYFQRDEQGLRGKIGVSLSPGWAATPRNKLAALSEYAAQLATAGVINRSEKALKECRQYVHLGNGQVGNNLAQTSTDPSGARQNHGDRVVADMLAVKELGTDPGLIETELGETDILPRGEEVMLPGHPLYDSQWSRMLRAEAQEKEDETWTPRRQTMRW